MEELLGKGNVIYILDRLVIDEVTGDMYTISLGMVGFSYEVLDILSTGNLVLNGVEKGHLVVTSKVLSSVVDIDGIMRIRTLNTVYVVNKKEMVLEGE